MRRDVVILGWRLILALQLGLRHLGGTRDPHGTSLVPVVVVCNRYDDLAPRVSSLLLVVREPIMGLKLDPTCGQQVELWLRNELLALQQLVADQARIRTARQVLGTVCSRLDAQDASLQDHVPRARHRVDREDCRVSP